MATASNLINIDVKVKDASKNLKKNEQAVQSFGKKGKKSLKDVGKSSEDTMGQLEALGNRFRYLSMVTGMLSAASIMLGKSLVSAAKEGEASMMKLGVMSATSGVNMQDANAAAKELASTGLITLSGAATTLSNLLASDLSLPQATELMKRMLDTSVLVKESLTDTYEEAMIKSSMGIRIFQERQVDAIGVNFLMNNVIREHGYTLGKTVNQMTNAEKHLAIYTHLMKETERYVGGAELASSTFGGSLDKLSASIKILKIELGQSLIPVIGELSEQLKKAAVSMGNLSRAHMQFTASVLMGFTVMTSFTTAFALIGALVPMVERGLKITTKGLKALGTVTLVMIRKFLFWTIVIGALITLLLRVTGVWDKWTGMIEKTQKKIGEMYKPMEKLGEKVEEVSDSVVKSMENMKRSIDLTWRSFWEDMAKFAAKHDETTTNLKNDIKSLKEEYAKSTKSIRDDFKRTMSDMSLSHSRNVEDLEREIEEETSKGIWADETKLRSLKLRLKRENEDYERNGKKNEDRRKEDLSDEKTKFDESLKKLKDKLAIEEKIEKDHINTLAKARLVTILDEIDTKERALKERLEQYERELLTIQKNAGLEEEAIGGVNDALEEVKETTKLTKEELEAMFEAGEKDAKSLKKELDILYYDMNTFWGNFAVVWDLWADSFYNTWSTIIKPILTQMKSDLVFVYNKIIEIIEILGTTAGKILLYIGDEMSKQWKKIAPTQNEIINWLSGREKGDVDDTIIHDKWGGVPYSLPPFQHGGIVPGTPGTPVPIMAHAGETVIPAGNSPVTININNPTVRDDQDIRSIANAVKDVLSRQQNLLHYT